MSVTDDLLIDEIVHMFEAGNNEGLPEKFYWAKRMLSANQLVQDYGNGVMEDRLKAWLEDAQKDVEEQKPETRGWPDGWPGIPKLRRELRLHLKTLEGSKLIQTLKRLCCQEYR